MNTRQAVVILADGFEEIEAVSVIDVLRRAGITVVVAAAAGVSNVVTGNHGISLVADRLLSDLSGNDIDLVALPGGMPGAQNLAENDEVKIFLRAVYRRGGYVAAICAGPLALHAAGLLDEKRVTCYPSFADQLTGAENSGRKVEVDGRVVTSQGPGTALLFGLKLAELLAGAEAARTVADAMLISTSAANEGY